MAIGARQRVLSLTSALCLYKQRSLSGFVIPIFTSKAIASKPAAKASFLKMKKDLEVFAVAEYKSNELRIARLEYIIEIHEREMRQLPYQMPKFEVAYRACLAQRLRHHQDRRDVLYTEAGSLVNQLNRKRHWISKFKDFLASVWTGVKQKVSKLFGRIRRLFHRKRK